MRNTLLILSLAFMGMCLQAQPVNNYMKNVLMPSPAAASLGKYTDIPVGTYTGVPGISIPFYTLSEGPLTLPVSLSYHASGVKVGEAPGWVGQNWTLNAGGMVSRTVQGSKDEAPTYGWLKSGAVPQPPVYDANGNVISGDHCGFVEHYISENTDGEPDLFSFNFAGYGGKFYFKKDGSAVLVPMQDLKISPQFTANASNITHLKGFTITTPDGTKYLFGDTGDGSPAIETTIGGGGDYPEIPSSWYLKRIETADGKFFITLNYAGDYSRTDYQPNRHNPCFNPAPGAEPLPNMSANFTFVKGHRIASIVTTTATVTFKPGAAREDLDVYSVAPYNNDPPKVLDSITITAGSFKKKFDFTYDYWVDNSTDAVTTGSTKINKRLRLLSVQETNADGSIPNPAWTFEYFAKSGSPNFMPHRVSRAVDHWGFYNGKNNGPYTSDQPNIPKNLFGSCIHGEYCTTWGETGGGSDRSTDETAMKYGTLKKITWPTGGYTEFDFEANDYYSTDPVNDTINLLHIDGAYSIGGYTCGTATFYGTPQNYSFAQSTLTDAKYEWKIKPNTTTCQCVEGVTAMRVKAYLASNNTLYAQSAVINISCSPAAGATGKGNLSAFFTPALQANVAYKFELVVTQGGADFKIRLPIVNTSNNVKVGGLRVKQVKTHDGISAANDIIRTYEYRDSTITSRSSGVLHGKPSYVHSYSWFPCRNNQPLCGSICAPGQCPQYENPSGGCNNNFYEHSITPISSFEGYHIGYYHVKELFNGNGAKSYTYYVETDPVPAQYPTPPTPARILSGNLKYSVTRDSAGVIRATESHTAYNDAYTESTDVMYKKILTSCGRFVTVYKIRTRPYREAAVSNVLDGVATSTTFTYDNQGRHLQKVTEEVTGSDGSLYRTKYKYALDYPCPSGDNCDENNGANSEAKAIYAMRKRYMIAIPIEQTSWLKRPSWGSHRLTGATYFQYDKAGASYDNIKLKYVQQVRPASPLTNFVESSIISGSSFFKYPNYKVEYNFVFSDAHGNLLSQWKQHDPAKEQYLWGHKQKLPIAKVVNAESNEIAFTSFEEPAVYTAAENGNWAVSPTGSSPWNNASGYAQTGKYGFNLSGRTLTASALPGGGSYTVSFWHRDGTVSVNGSAVSTTGSGWKYAETTLTFEGAGNVAVTGSGAIDELRLHPADALMRTFSYENGTMLLLSADDENSVPTHYDYDVFMRLQALRDQDRNILQTHEYNYHATGSVINNVKTRNVLIAGQTTVGQVSALTGADVRRVFTYLDGLGRPIQSSEVAQSPTALDMVAHLQYDKQNREARKYIPYTAAGNGGAYRTDAAAAQAAFANTWGAGGYGYAETRFDRSPLNRPLEQAAPGATWRIGQGRTAEFLYRGNTTTDAVRDFTNSAGFGANLLAVLEETDENERKKLTFTDKLGRVVMVRQQLANTPSNEDDHWARTYTVYDDFGRVAAVIPPEAAKKMKTSGNWDWTSATYANMIYKYAYDSRGRMISKTVPSGGATAIAYDRLDRPVLTTDAKGFKIFTRYDILGRPVVSGRYKGAASPGASDPLYETPNTTAPHYYTSTAFPTDNNLDVYKVFYYDDYDLNNNGSLGADETYADPGENGYETAAFLRVRGKPAAVKTGILKTDQTAPTNFLTTRTYYDKEYSVIQVHKQNHLSGSDLTSSAYDFANRLTKTRRDHTATPPGGTLKTYTIREEYVYDHAGRLRFTRHRINSNNWVVTSAPVYDELGRLADKRLHASNYDGASPITVNSTFNYLQSLDYTYNIRGWMAAINDVSTCATQSGDQIADLFKLQLSYDAPAGGGTAQYNGNISTMQWRTYIGTTCLAQQQYRFSYDAANRLTAADHYTNSSGSWTFTNNYTESNITYDLNGNLKTYTRRGLTSAPNTFGVIDNLTYAYSATIPDRLVAMTDAGNITRGFKYKNSIIGDNYLYDANGNMIQDKHKDLTINYNHLNLPAVVTDLADAQINLTYTADGEKLTKTAGGVTKNYVAGIEYAGANLEAIYHAEGRCVLISDTFRYEYTLKDHLGNARVNWRANGASVVYIEDMHYYPFGMQMEGIGTQNPANKYLYNGKERNEDLGLNWSDYGARWYDASVGRWWSVDPMAEATIVYSAYHYALNNPILYIDPEGMSPVGADGLTNEQWIDASRQGRQSNFERYRKENRRDEMDKGLQRHKIQQGIDGVFNDNIQESASVIAFGTRVYSSKGKLLSDRVEGYNLLFGGPPWYYNGEKYEDKNSLYLAILWDKAKEQVGIKDVVAIVFIITGSATEAKRFVTPGSSRGTSVLSRELGDRLGRSTSRIPTITNFPPRITYTKSIGRAVARWVPVVGWGILGYDAYRIYTNTETTYNKIISN